MVCIGSSCQKESGNYFFVLNKNRSIIFFDFIQLLDLESSSLARTDSTSSQSLQNSSPELLLSLAYNGTTGRLNVTMIKGNNNSNKINQLLK